MRRWISFTAFIAMACLGASAQNFTKYNFGENELTRINPASGIHDGSQAYIAYKHTWSNSSGYSENPNDVDAGMTWAAKWGAVSAEVDYDGYSFFDRHEIKLNYSYVWALDDAHHSRLSAGGGLSLGIDDINFNKLGYEGILDGQSCYCSPDFNLGFEYNNDHIRTGIGAMNLIATGVKFKDSKLVRNPRTVMAYFIYRFDLHQFGLSPVIFCGYSERTEVMLGLRADYNKWIAFTYSFRAMEMAHICTLNLAIPKTPLSFDLSYSKCAFYKDQTLAFALRFRW